MVNDQIANRDLKLKFISVRKAKAEEEKVNTHTHRSGFRDSARVKRLRQIGMEMVQDSRATT